MQNEDLICQCMNVTRGELIHAIKTKKLVDLEQIQIATEACTVCGSCSDDIEDLLKEINS